MSQAVAATARASIAELLTRRILVLDGAMGTMVQTYADSRRPTSAASASATTRRT